MDCADYHIAAPVVQLTIDVKETDVETIVIEELMLATTVDGSLCAGEYRKNNRHQGYDSLPTLRCTAIPSQGESSRRRYGLDGSWAWRYAPGSPVPPGAIIDFRLAEHLPTHSMASKFDRALTGHVMDRSLRVFQVQVIGKFSAASQSNTHGMFYIEQVDWFKRHQPRPSH